MKSKRKRLYIIMEISLKIENKAGLHARPAALFAQKASSFQSNITILKGERKANAKSIINIMGLGVKQGETILLKIDGPDAEEAASVLGNLVADKFGEE